MFRKRPEISNNLAAIHPDQIQPTSGTDYIHRGWQYFTLKQYDRARADFQEALRQDGENMDALYGLGLTYKASGEGSQAVETFQQFLSRVDKIEDIARASMLRRLSQNHINDITNGDWNLEKEIWQKRA